MSTSAVDAAIIFHLKDLIICFDAVS